MFALQSCCLFPFNLSCGDEKKSSLYTNEESQQLIYKCLLAVCNRQMGFGDVCVYFALYVCEQIKGLKKSIKQKSAVSDVS